MENLLSSSSMKKHKKRKLDVLVLSDIHLGTFGCRATKLLNYLKTVKPKVLILNGDIIDIWQFNKRYFPSSHMKVIKYLTSLLSKGTKVYYVTGNHDEMLRKFNGFQIGSFEIVNKIILELDGKKAWFFHGDVFDVTMKHSRWLAKLGGKGYDFLIILNTLVNWLSEKMGKGRISFSKRIKNGVKSAVKHINNFEKIASDIALDKGYDYVVCGHIHQPQKTKFSNEAGNEVLYLNSGDWVENMTALEYVSGEWSIYEYMKDVVAQQKSVEMEEIQYEADLYKATFKNKDLFNELIQEIQFGNLESRRAY